ncbi:MAG: hypothetical protein HQL87_06845 [Magnetococcales bacterium]|nr:hypothetical protein [Magnetococcales bacterium]
MNIGIPTPEEDAASIVAALNDPDNQPLTEIELNQFKRLSVGQGNHFPEISTTARFGVDEVAFSLQSVGK